MSNNYEDGGVNFDPEENVFNNDEDGGIYFDPEDEELIKKHLIPKLETYLKPKSKDKDCKDFIEMKDVYAMEPWLLDHTYNPLFKKNEWFYFVTRTQVSVKNTGRGKNSKRRITGDNDGGSWKPNAKKYIEDEEKKEIIGKMQTLKFTKGNNNKKKQKREDGTSVVVPGSNSSWIMYEYSLVDENTFQELVLCRIRKLSNSKDEEDHNESIPASSSEQQPTSIEAMEVTHNVEEEGWVGLDDQQQTPIYAAPPARLGDRSLPIQVDEDDEEDELMNQELDEHLF
ncbi:hypothetical protein N665_0352s0031 [Sinapis alba]|nr:hypothetical protein N665_0352s0031 [Sinapis alba]